MARDKRFIGILADGESPDNFRSETANATRKVGVIATGATDMTGISPLDNSGMAPKMHPMPGTNPLSDMNRPPDTRRPKRS